MTKTIKMDRAGRVVIPRATRERYGLADRAHELEVEETVDGIVLRPRGEEASLERHPSGWLVFRSEEPDTLDPVRAVNQSRERRHRTISEDTVGRRRRNR